jgi:uncharacterized membrane protein YphA (DoxX/SURF4 family)
MNQRFTLLFLILLRTAIGWHFFFEAVEKYHSVNLGPTETNRPWTSEGYFREASGPMGALMRRKLGDVDEMALARMTVPVGESGARLPPALEAEWNDYFDRFAKHYGLDAQQTERAKAKLRAEKELTAVWFTARVPSVKWLLAGLWSDFDRKPFKRTYPSGTVDVNLSVAERVEEYRDKVKEYRLLQRDKLSAMGKDVEKAHRAAARSELAALRKELTDLVDGRTAEMKAALDSELTPEQRAKKPEPDGIKFITVIDRMTIYGLMLIGIGLMFGMFSRTSAAAGAAFLLMTVLTTPALPWLPAPPTAEGNYVFINKNVIEMFALMMLVCIPSGRWFGVDALVRRIKPLRKDNQNLENSALR